MVGLKSVRHQVVQGTVHLYTMWWGWRVLDSRFRSVLYTGTPGSGAGECTIQCTGTRHCKLYLHHVSCTLHTVTCTYLHHEPFILSTVACTLQYLHPAPSPPVPLALLGHRLQPRLQRLRDLLHPRLLPPPEHGRDDPGQHLSLQHFSQVVVDAGAELS